MAQADSLYGKYATSDWVGLGISGASDVATVFGVGAAVKGGKGIFGTVKAAFTGFFTHASQANSLRTDVIYSGENWQERAGSFAKDICPFWGTKRAWDNIHSSDWKVDIDIK